MSIYSALPGDEVAIWMPSQEGQVLQRTTTDVQMRLPDGYEAWFDIEDIEGGPVTVHEVVKGGNAQVRGGDRFAVVDRTTASLKLRYPDGREVWHEVEDLEPEADQAGSEVKVGTVTRVAPRTVRARMKSRTTTDALVVFSNGVEVWRDVDDLVPTAVAPSEASVTRLRQIFERVDTSKDGFINKRELIKICRNDASVAEFFGLSSQIRQEDGSRDSMEKVFQAIDTDSDRQLSWSEFRAFFLECVSGRTGRASPLRIQSSPAALMNAPAAITNA